MTQTPHKLLDADRSAFCSRADLSAMLGWVGVDVRRNGADFVCKLRLEERTASCHLYPLSLCPDPVHFCPRSLLEG